ncbi:MAG: radical SAM protein [Deltaproteobacteria bacterium RBG_16_47_11]|nr:MAG: radical SAM protein [Deltaproteobacteria bacterium RBG_16_47_11]
MTFIPSYIRPFEKGELQQRIRVLKESLKECRLCPRECGVNRLNGEVGVCQAGLEPMVSSAFPHFGEEPPLVGYHGSGTIFLTHCNLRCIFCQNYDISHLGNGEQMTSSDMARVMVRLQEMGCHNINFVTPTHYAPQIVASLPDAIEKGLRLPIVYNCSGYESIEVIRLLEGVVDIYMPDVKYMDRKYSKKFSNAPDYPEVIQGVLKEMHRQVGDLTANSKGVAERGLLIRHLVMPNGVASSEAVLRFIAEEISVHSYVNIMDQYRPEYRAHECPEINRRITQKEYLEATQWAKRYQLYRGF